ncbi:MAG: hypothetical protein ACFFD5_02950 [Candidatus Thorarchaeota archaeon]
MVIKIPGKIYRVLRLKNYKKKRFLVLSSILISFILMAALKNLDIYANLGLEDQKFVNNEDIQIKNLKTQDLAFDNTFTGKGSVWNVTHYANRTKTDLGVSFNNNSYDDSNAQVELYGWNGYQLNSTIMDLYDTRNWINGTFHAGSFGGSPSGENDSAYIDDWTFKENDVGSYSNPMSGNYYDDSSPESDNEDCLELKIEENSPGQGHYDIGDKCWWEWDFDIDRGDVDEAWLSFAVFPKYGDGYNNHMVLQVLVNDKLIWGNGLQSLLDASGSPSSGQWYNPYPIYLDGNDDQIFADGVKSMNITLEFKRVSGTAPSPYAPSYSVLFDNVSLIVKSKAKPTQLELQLNDEDVNDNANYGEGNLGIIGNWNGSLQSSVIANFSSDLDWPFTYQDDGTWISYKVELNANLTLYATKSYPETYYTADPDLEYQGSSFIATNNSNINWSTYAHMELPAGYEETNMTVEYPSDYNLTGIFFSLNPDSLSQAYIEEYGYKKVVNIPVSSITDNTNGFWKLTAESPNYCKEMEIYNNVTGDWELNNQFLSGEYINITAIINNSQLISGYIQQTQAQLQIKFPNGTIWSIQDQIKAVDNIGMVYFDPIKIPNDIPNYEAGEYEAIITWNNSYSSFGSNETGIIYKNFIVIHDSLLYPDQGIFFIENVIDDRIINIKVSYRDLIDGTAIENAQVYTDFTGTDETLSETSPGFYLYEFNATNANAGNNTVTIYANSTYYSNKIINITVEVIKETILNVETDFFTVPWNQNFTVKFNYTEKNNPENGIDTADITIDEWLGDYHLTQPSIGQYELECNTSAYAALTLQSFIISINQYKYEPQSVLIRVSISELESSLILYLDSDEKSDGDKIQVQANEVINVTVLYQDNITKQHLSGAEVSLSGNGNFTEINNQYNYTINTNDLNQTITPLTIFADLDNYESKSIEFLVEITDRETDLLLFLDSDPKNDSAKIQVEVNEFINVTVIYRDNESGQFLSGADVALLERGNFTEINNQYNYTIDTNDLNQGITILTVYAELDKYQPQIFYFYVEVVERESDLKLLIDEDDMTLDPVITSTIDKTLNITVYYTDNQTGTHIGGASVQLIQLVGEGGTIDFNETLNQYSVFLNTSDLKIGVNLYSIVAHANNYQIKTIDLRITVNRIKITPSILTGESYLTGFKGETVRIKIILNDTNVLPSGELIKNANVTFMWSYGGGRLLDPENDGIYEADLDLSVPIETYILRIYVEDEFDEYVFEYNSENGYEITLNVNARPGLDLTWLIIIFSAAIIGLISIFTAYQKHYKYPPMVRKIRKIRKKIRKSKKTKPIMITEREDLINNLLEDKKESSKLSKKEVLELK